MVKRHIRQRAFQIAGFVLACLVVACFFLGDPRILFVRWHDFSGLPFGVINHIEVAATRGHLKLSSLSLVCTDKSQLRLVLRTRMPEREFLPDKGEATLIAQCMRTNLKFDVEFASRGFMDVLTSGPLSHEQVAELATWCGGAYESDNKVSFMTMETGAYLSGIADERSIRRFDLFCPFPPRVLPPE